MSPNTPWYGQLLVALLGLAGLLLGVVIYAACFLVLPFVWIYQFFTGLKK